MLAHIHTFNDADVIDGIIDAVLRQTHPVDGIIVVDNASTDGTLERPSLKHATVLRHSENQGTSGAIATGMRVALEQDYDWIWVFDADSIPELDALRKLLDRYANFPQNLQNEVCFLSCLHINMDDGLPQHGGVFTRYGFSTSKPSPDERFYPCHFNVWSGCLFRLAAVRQIGIPNADYVLDWGEGEYGYRIMQAGYKNFVCADAILRHNIRGYRTVTPVKVQRGSETVTEYEFAPIRCYYSCRNIIYFLLYDVSRGRHRLLPRAIMVPGTLMLSFLLSPRNHGKHIRACLRGIWHGVTGNIRARY